MTAAAFLAAIATGLVALVACSVGYWAVRTGNNRAQTVLIFACVGVMLCAYALSDMPFFSHFVVNVLGLLIGFALPYFIVSDILRSRRERRQ